MGKLGPPKYKSKDVLQNLEDCAGIRSKTDDDDDDDDDDGINIWCPPPHVPTFLCVSVS